MKLKNTQLCLVARTVILINEKPFSWPICNDCFKKLEIRSVERGICPIATSTINERTVPIIMAGCMAYARNGRISTFGVKSDVTVVFHDPDFL